MMKHIYTSFILLLLVQFANERLVAQTTTTSSHTHTKSKTTVKTDGAIVAYSYSDSDSSYQNTDDQKAKYDTVEKNYSIEPGAPIFIESKMRNLNVESWDGDQVKIVAKYQYTNDKDRHLDLDSIFQKNNIQIKSSKNAFQILASSNDKSSFSVSSSFNSDDDDDIDEAKQASIDIEQARKDNEQAKKDMEQGRKDMEQSRKDFEQAKKDAKKLQSQKWIVVKSRSKSEEKAISAKIKKLSEELAIAAKNNESDKIEKLSQEIGNLSSQLAAQSLAGMTINFNGNNLSNFGIDSSTFNFTPPMPPTPPITEKYLGTHFKGISGFTFNGDKSGKEWTIYIPKNHKLSIENKYGNIKISNELENVKIDNRYGNVTTEDLKNLQLNLEYGNYSGGDLTNADINIKNGKVKAQNIGNLNLNSKYSTIDLEDVENANINSVSDNVDVNAFQTVQADKNYGSFRIASLGKSLKLSGSSADLKIRNLAPTVSNIEIDNKYANIAIPMDDVENYSVVLNGSFNTSNDNFTDKKSITSTKNSTTNFIPLTNSLTNQNTKVAFSSKDNSSYEVKKGDSNKMKVQLNCTSCTIDFK